MGHRSQRVGNLIRNTIGQLLLSKLSDPRVDPALLSITRVEVAEDLLTAKVYVSVLGSEAKQRMALAALRHAAGHIQELMMRQIQLRNTPVLSFELDKQFKKTLETLQVLRKVSLELQEQDRAAGADDATADPGADEDGKNVE